MNIIYVVVLVLSVVSLNQEIYGMTEAQVKNAVKLVRNVCQPKFKVTNAQIDAMHKGTFEDDPKTNCYLNCGLTSLKFMGKNGKMDYEYASAQVKNLPENWQGPIGHALDVCRDATKSDDKCQAARQLAKCMYDTEPDIRYKFYLFSNKI